LDTNAQPVLVGGKWLDSDATGSFQAINPDTGATLEHVYPVSDRDEIEAALRAGSEAAAELEDIDPGQIADALDGYADRIEAASARIVAAANLETALPLSPRLADVELPRTAGQLRQAAAACRDRNWCDPTIDSASNIRSRLGPLGGPVVVFGPNNFPLAFNAMSGGDFAAALAAGNPVIAKAHSSHPRTTQLLAEAAAEAVEAAGLPSATVQMIYRTSHEDGAWMVSHPLTAATGYTGSRSAGLVLKEAADRAGKPIYLELSSVNPVFFLPGALRERGAELAAEFHGSALLGTGQFCTNPGIVVLAAGEEAEAFVAEVRSRFAESPVGALLGSGGVKGMSSAVNELVGSGAELLTGGDTVKGGCRFQNTLLRASGDAFLADPEGLQTEAFGNGNLVVVARDETQLVQIAAAFEGNLTGCIYSHTGNEDDAIYGRVAKPLRRRVGRLLNDQMPTGVAVTAAMNHGGPYPATGHPGFTAVGIPAALRRFAMLECFDHVREDRLPSELRDANPTGSLWRMIDGQPSQADVGAAAEA